MYDTSLSGRTHRTPTDSLPARITRLLERLLEWPTRSGPAAVGPLRTHRFGHGDEDETATETAADVLEAVRESARKIHDRLAHREDVFAVELLGATGSGKTALIEWLLEHVHDGERVGVIAGDVTGADDAERLRAHGVPVVNVSTGKDCHLDPDRIEAALAEFDLTELDVLYVENVGNMVCPADFPLGTTVRLVVVSPTEGDDVIRKHPHLFQVADCVTINKIDLAAAVGAETEQMVADAAAVAPDVPVVETSVETGEGLRKLAETLDGFRGHAEHDHVADHHAHAVEGDGHDHAAVEDDGHGHTVVEDDGHGHTDGGSG